MPISINITKEQADYCRRIGRNVSDGARNAVSFHQEYYDLMKSLQTARTAFNDDILTAKEYHKVVVRKINETIN